MSQIDNFQSWLTIPQHPSQSLHLSFHICPVLPFLCYLRVISIHYSKSNTVSFQPQSYVILLENTTSTIFFVVVTKHYVRMQLRLREKMYTVHYLRKQDVKPGYLFSANIAGERDIARILT